MKFEGRCNNSAKRWNNKPNKTVNQFTFQQDKKIFTDLLKSIQKKVYL